MNDIPNGLKVTPLYQVFKDVGGNFTEFGGFYMPLNFKEGIVNEHLAVRNDVGLFDVSHMGEIRITGVDASVFLNYVSTNSINKIGENEVQYHLLCSKDGGVIDDMLVYKFDSNNLWCVCNASNKEVLYNYLLKVLKEKSFDAKIIDESEDVSVISVQGPNSKKMLEKVYGKLLIDSMTFINKDNFIISRTGYTGEDGFEIYGSNEEIITLTKDLLRRGVTPCGLGSRDTLRFEAGLPLYGHELSKDISPVEAGLNFAIDFSKEEFVGKLALERIKLNLNKKIVGLSLIDKGIARESYKVFDQDKLIGYITSGFMIPGTKKSYANALIDNNYQNGDIVSIEVRNKRVSAKIRSKRYIKKTRGQ